MVPGGLGQATSGTGFLILRSMFMPRIFGALLAISGLGWMLYLVPRLAVHLFFPYVAAASAMGEIPLMLWLLLRGVDTRRWREPAGSAVPA